MWGWERAAAQEEPVFRGLLGQSVLAPPTRPAALVSLVSAVVWPRRRPCPSTPYHPGALATRSLGPAWGRTTPGDTLVPGPSMPEGACTSEWPLSWGLGARVCMRLWDGPLGLGCVCRGHHS